MQNFYSSILKRYYPRWSKIRKDESSKGAMLIESLANLYGEARENLLYIVNSKEVLNNSPLLDYESIVLYFLMKDEDFAEQFGTSQDRNADISVTGDGYGLERIFNLNNFIKKEPRRISLSKVKDNVNIINVTAKNDYTEEVVLSSKGEHIYITLEDVSSEDTSDYPLYNVNTNNSLFDENYFIVLRGLGIDFKPVEEVIEVRDQYTFRSSIKFTKLKKLTRDPRINIVGGSSIQLVGFSSRFSFSNFNLNKTFIKTSYSLAASDDKDIENVQGYTLDNNLLLQVFKEEENNFLRFYYIPFIHGKFYRSLEDYETRRKVISEQLLLGLEGEIKDYCYDEPRNKLYTLNSDLTISVFPLQKEGFKKTVLSRTKDVSLSLESILQRVKLGSTHTINSVLLNPKEILGEYVIAREIPSSRIEEVEAPIALEFLDEDYNWSQTGHVFTSSFSKGKKSFESNYFDITFDELGQWDFFIIEPNSNIKPHILGTNSYLERMNSILNIIESNKKDINSTLKINRYSFLVEYVEPINNYSWANLEDVNINNEFKMFKDRITNELKVVDLTDGKLYLLKEHMDYYYFDFNNKIIGTVEEYNSITIKYEDLVLED